jgi:hypothetical protein
MRILPRHSQKFGFVLAVVAFATSACVTVEEGAGSEPPSAYAYRVYMTPGSVQVQNVYPGTPTLTPVAEVTVAPTVPAKALIGQLSVSALPGEYIAWQTSYEKVGEIDQLIGNQLQHRYTQRGTYSATFKPIACKHADLTPCHFTIVPRPYKFVFATTG